MHGEYRVNCQAMDLTSADLAEGAGVLAAVKNKACTAKNSRCLRLINRVDAYPAPAKANGSGPVSTTLSYAVVGTGTKAGHAT